MSIDIKKELAELGHKFETDGDDNPPATSFSSITEASASDVTFCYYESDKAAHYMSQSDAGIILCNKSMVCFLFFM
jgi:UDP-3-O-[3-hydroxymyristoyl] glucosamine N-acyltransferase